MSPYLRKAGYQERYFENRHLTLHYLQGPPQGEPLILFPGQTMPLESYQRVLPALARRFQVYAVDVHGHGKSGWAAERYRFDKIGEDMAMFLEAVVGRPACLSGNSSGGLIALWLAAYAGEWVTGVIAEDAPLFSAEWPRLRDDCFVHPVFIRCVEALTGPEGRNVAQIFDGFEIPVEGKKTPMRMPKLFSALLAGYIRAYRLFRPQGAIDLPLLPLHPRLFIKGLSEYDPAFTAAFVDGSAVKGFDHEAMLRNIRCPVSLLHAHWFRHERFGLVGAMDDRDAAKAQRLIGDVEYVPLATSHVVHLSDPKRFIALVERFCDRKRGSTPHVQAETDGCDAPFPR